MVVSSLCVDFLCQASVTVALLLIVQGWLKWVKMETWSHNGHCLVCKKLAFFLGIPDVNCSGSQNSEHTRLPIACSRRSDSGERCKVKGSAKK